MEKVSVVMSTYNEKDEYICESIESILNQTYDDLEFIIVLDNPQNNSLNNIVKRYADGDSRIKVITNEKNIGLTASLNKGLEYVTGKYVARMDADDIADKERIRKQLSYMRENNLDIVGCETRRISEEGAILIKKTNKSYKPECIKESLLYSNCVAHPTWLVKKCVYEQLNGYREIYTCEDYDFLLRAVNNNYRIGICDEILLSYRINKVGISRSNSFKQMLSSYYLQKNIERLNDVEQRDIDEHILKIISDKRKLKYEMAYQSLQRCLREINNKKFSSILYGIKSVIISPFIVINIKNIIKLRLVRRKYI